MEDNQHTKPQTLLKFTESITEELKVNNTKHFFTSLTYIKYPSVRMPEDHP